MSNTGELSAAVAELRRCGEALVGIADSFRDFFSGDADAGASIPPKTEPPAPEKKAVTLEAVRAILAEKSRAGHTAEIRELLKKHGAERLSEIVPAEFPDLLAEAEVL